MRDLVLFIHILLGLMLILFPIIILIQRDLKSTMSRTLAVLAAVASWAILVPAGILYLVFYPATKSLILAGGWPWAHRILMETKEHWGLLLPMIGTYAVVLTFKNDQRSSKWWILLIVLSIALAIMGRLVTMAGVQ